MKRKKKDEIIVKPHISPSQISSYTKCGEQYRRRYIEKEIIPPGFALIKGTCIHKGAEENFKQKMDTGLDLKREDIAMIAVETFDSIHKNEGIYLTPDEESIGKKKLIGEAKDSIVDMADVFTEQVAPKYQPDEVEKEYNIELPNSSHNLKCIIDLETPFSIVDIKTSKKKWGQDQADRHPQFTFYSMIKKSMTGKIPKFVVENIVSTKKVAYHSIETSRIDGDFERLVNRINRVLDGINSGNFAPAHEGSWACNPKYCGYYNSCKVRS